MTVLQEMAKDIAPREYTKEEGLALSIDGKIWLNMS